MEATLAVIADCANLTTDGKVNIMGIYGEVDPPMLPFSLPAMFLVIGFAASPAEIGTHQCLRVALLDTAGNRLLALDNNMVVPEPKRPGSNASVVSIVGLNGVPFAAAGDYVFTVHVNDEAKAAVPFRVNDPANMEG